VASDGKPRFDLTEFDEAFFERLRERVVAAGERGMYVAVMLFEGWALHLSPAPDHVEGHPFHAGSNVNGIGIGIGSILDYQVLPLDPRVQELQEAYVRKVVDTLHDLPNVLWEVANESSGGGKVDAAFAEVLEQAGTPEWGDSTAWQYWVIGTVRGRGEALWAWKSFLRGHHPVLMDFGLIGGVNPPGAAFEPARYAMGDTLQPPIRGVRPGRPVLEEDRALTAVDRAEGLRTGLSAVLRDIAAGNT